MQIRKDGRPPITPEVLIPDLLAAYPQARPVLDRYGLRGCGGPNGPMEPLAFFARAHDVPLDRLLDELHAADGNPQPAHEPDDADSVADTIYRPFFRAGIGVVLTLGAVWGAYLLLRIGILGSFVSVGIHEVNAHGHAQIFGWVGLFVMGFAYQAFPRFKHTNLVHPRLAWLTLWLMLGGILVRSGAQALIGVVPGMLWTGLLGSLSEIGAISLFGFIVLKTLRSSAKPWAVYDAYVCAALAWFLAQAIYGTVYFAATATAPTRDALLGLVSTWQAPLRDMQVHGFILLMVLGVSQRVFPYFYGLRRPNPRRSAALLTCLNVAVALEVTGLILMRSVGHVWASVWYAGVLLLAGSVVALVSGWGLWGESPDADRSLKFLRTAYVWLFISLTMLVLLPGYQFGLLPWLSPQADAVEIGFSHAYYGAIRHAITVGFVSLMIVGVAAKVVPTLSGVDVHALSPLWAPYVLLNLGCSMRVLFQTLTDFGSWAYPIAGVSGLFEVAALALWGVHLLGVMSGRVRTVGRQAGSARAVEAGQAVRPTDRVGAVLDANPQLLSVFVEAGFTPLANPLLRQTLAKHITIESACRKLGQDADAFTARLNALLAGGVELRQDGVQRSALLEAQAAPSK